MYYLPFSSNIASSFKFTGYGGYVQLEIFEVQIITKAEVIFLTSENVFNYNYLLLNNNLKLLFDLDNKSKLFIITHERNWVGP